MFTANNMLIFAPGDIYSYEGAWIINSVLFGLLALMYLITFCMLSSTMKDISNVGLHTEKQKMTAQFYFFGTAYLLKSIIFGLEIWLWNQTPPEWFAVILCDAILIIFSDVLPITYITCVHNSTFSNMKYAKLAQQL